MPRLSDMNPCQVCGHVFGEKHRLLPGAWGGTYEEDNVASLYPNHHAAIHLLMKWCGLSYRTASPADASRLNAYLEDRPLMKFFAFEIKPILVAVREASRTKSRGSPPDDGSTEQA